MQGLLCGVAHARGQPMPLIVLLSLAAALSPPPSGISAALGRRAVLTSAVLAAVPRLPAHATAATDERSRLLAAIDADGDVEAALAALLPLDPSRGGAAVSPALDGEWKLLWSAKTEAFSPLLQLPRPIRPGSFQLLGDPATREVGAGRVAQVLRWGAVEQVLSSGVLPAGDDRSMLEIFPPFRLELGVRGLGKVTLVEAGSDADFRALNARDADAQAAPKNRYAQLYLETGGLPGDLRVSKVVSGDPVIVGSIFVHQRL